MAVFAHHIGTTSGGTVLPGEFLGVDVFFVLSGYLITSLLVVEVQRTGRRPLRRDDRAADAGTPGKVAPSPSR